MVCSQRLVRRLSARVLTRPIIRVLRFLLVALVALEELLESVSLSELVAGVAYSTTPQQLERIPALMRSVVAEDSQLDFEACRFVRISAFSYDHEFEIRSCHVTYDDFENSVHHLNRRILEVLSQHRIENPFPTQTLELHSSESSQ